MCALPLMATSRILCISYKDTKHPRTLCCHRIHRVTAHFKFTAVNILNYWQLSRASPVPLITTGLAQSKALQLNRSAFCLLVSRTCWWLVWHSVTIWRHIRWQIDVCRKGKCHHWTLTGFLLRSALLRTEQSWFVSLLSSLVLYEDLCVTFCTYFHLLEQTKAFLRERKSYTSEGKCQKYHIFLQWGLTCRQLQEMVYVFSET